MSVAAKKLTVAEFLAMDFPDEELNRYELDDGEVMVVPGPKPKHSTLQTLLTTVLGVYQARHPELMPVVEPTLVLGEHELRRPDLIVVLDPAQGGQCIEEESCYSGPPQIIVEVLSSKPWRDLIQKRELYARVGIPEYWVLNPEDAEAAFLRLAGRDYERFARLREGMYETPVLPGFRLDVGALFRRDTAALIAALGA
jgi:Uma2 family endonuclease